MPPTLGKKSDSNNDCRTCSVVIYVNDRFPFGNRFYSYLFAMHSFQAGLLRENVRAHRKSDVHFVLEDLLMKNLARGNSIHLAAVLVMFGIAIAILTAAAPAFAGEQAALDVYYDDVCLKSFSMSELKSIAQKEGSKKYTFSGYNTYPTPKSCEAVEGPTVEGVLEAALKANGQKLDQIGEDQSIGFRANDGLEEQFLKGTLLKDRYFFPDFIQEKDQKGQAVQESSMLGAIQVPAVISLREEGQIYGEKGNYEVGRLLFGQLSPNEQNHSMFVKYLVTKDTDSPKQRGRIIIYGASAKPGEALSPIRTAEDGPEGITLDRSVNASHAENGARYWIHFTTDGTDPGVLSAMYNYNNYNFGKDTEKINRPILPGAGAPLKVRVFGYNRMESSVSTFYFPGKVTVKAPALQGKAAIVKWKAAPDADGYQIQRAEKKTGPYKLVKTIRKGRASFWKDKTTKKGKTYYYKLRAFRINEGNTGYGSFTAVKHIKVK